MNINAKRPTIFPLKVAFRLSKSGLLGLRKREADERFLVVGRQISRLDGSQKVYYHALASQAQLFQGFRVRENLLLIALKYLRIEHVHRARCNVSRIQSSSSL